MGAGVYGQTTASPLPVNIKGSRIDSDVQRVIDFTNRINRARNAVQRHTSTLGYFSEAPAAQPADSVKPISNDLVGSLADLGQAIDGLDNALSLFD